MLPPVTVTECPHLSGLGKQEACVHRSKWESLPFQMSPWVSPLHFSKKLPNLLLVVFDPSSCFLVVLVGAPSCQRLPSITSHIHGKTKGLTQVEDDPPLGGACDIHETLVLDHAGRDCDYNHIRYKRQVYWTSTKYRQVIRSGPRPRQLTNLTVFKRTIVVQPIQRCRAQRGCPTRRGAEHRIGKQLWRCGNCGRENRK
jgi:hypothetical protein